MSTFTLSLPRLDDADSPTVAERLLREVEWPELPRVGEKVGVGFRLCLECTVANVRHEEGDVVVALGGAELDEEECAFLAEQGWQRNRLPESMTKPAPCVRPASRL